MSEMSKLATVLVSVFTALSASALTVGTDNWESEGGNVSPAKCTETKIKIREQEMPALVVTAVRKENFWGDVRKTIKDEKLSETPVLTVKFKASDETAKLGLPIPSIRVTDSKGVREYAPATAFVIGKDGWTVCTWDTSTSGKLAIAETFRLEIICNYDKIPDGKKSEFYFVDINFSAKETAKK
ncbi:MAG TPA: hypothetical protein DET40_04320 [Lentisphaeria bacterium]|nr:MAG: hypothetical protein A2X45_11315 [Lentisphaerae bacterium GWF2_50_93]HCE42751.1 hypothetical protein [Lentisphaeria bacterium]